MQTKLEFPIVYKNGEGVISEIGSFCKTYGKKIVITGGHQALAAVEAQIRDSIAAAKLEVLETIWFGGECTFANIDELTAKVKTLGADLIIGVGGGRALDTAKAAAFHCGIPCVSVPTIAATCAAMTPLTLVNDEHGGYLKNSNDSVTPVGVFVDPTIIAKAPARWLYAGLGDTLAKLYEYRSTASGVESTSRVIGAINNSHTCYDIIKKYGKGSKEAVLAQTANADLSYAIDAIIYYAGMCSILGGEKLRGAAAHCVYFGFTYIPEAHKWGHGLLVGFGNLVLLALEDRSDAEILEEIQLAVDCGVPVTLAQIATLTEDDLKVVAEVACRAGDMKNMPFEVTEDMVITAIKRVDDLGKQIQG